MRSVCSSVCLVDFTLIVNAQNQELYDAAKEGNLSKVLAALDKGANVNWQTTDWVMELHDATTTYIATYFLCACITLSWCRGAPPLYS
jgi:hypothetical protein